MTQITFNLNLDTVGVHKYITIGELGDPCKPVTLQIHLTFLTEGAPSSIGELIRHEHAVGKRRADRVTHER